MRPLHLYCFVMEKFHYYFRSNISDVLSQSRMSSIKSQSNNDSLEQAFRQVDETKGLMKTQIDKVLEREDKLSNLEQRADRLQEQAEDYFGQLGNYGTPATRKNNKKKFLRKTERCALL